MLPARHKFLVHERGDDVGVAIADITVGEDVLGVFMDDDSTITVSAGADVPLGHKIAIAAREADGPVIEYGVRIGTTPRGFAVGEHVHTHNLISARW